MRSNPTKTTEVTLTEAAVLALLGSAGAARGQGGELGLRPDEACGEERRATHELNEQAQTERDAWLVELLR